ncbi:MAG: HD domain-containing phosphohydrolase [Planctomycetaceae bacterium]
MGQELLTSRPTESHSASTVLADESAPRLREADRDLLRRYAESSGLPFFGVDAASGRILDRTDPESVGFLPEAVRHRLPEISDSTIWEHPSGLSFYALPLSEDHAAATVAVGYVRSRPDLHSSQDLVIAAADEGRSQQELQDWLGRLVHCPREMLEHVLSMLLGQFRNERLAERLQSEIDELGIQIEHTYEEISLLYGLARNLQISRSPAELAELCVDRLHSLLEADGNAIWLDERNGRPCFVAAGAPPFDEAGMTRLAAQLEGHDWSRPLVRNHLRGTPLGNDFPGLDNLVLVPIAAGVHRSGWIASCNLNHGREFGTVEANLLNSVATILGTHIRNIDLYQQHQELLLCFVRSLVSTLDAKDPYTRGHSERVALIARRLAKELQLSEGELHDIYISGLLHDIGKIGVDDRILRKPGRLTDDEFRQIQQHPVIGYNILLGLRNLQNVLPGVRNHHESYNGKGYPDRLAGEQIPMIARILAVADSYDAMGSDRPYRKGMDRGTIEDIFRRGAGQQWDAHVIDAYFRISDEIERICAEHTLDNDDLFAGPLSFASGI